MSGTPSSLHALLRQQLLLAREQDEAAARANAAGVMMEIPATGKILSSAYEQLRNAAEYAEEHLLLQRAIKRFCKRTLFLTKHRRPQTSLGSELIVELVQAGYLRGGSLSKDTAAAIDRLIEQYMAAYHALTASHVPRDKAMDWVLAQLATEAEQTLSPHHTHRAIAFFAYHYFLQAISRAQFDDEPAARESYEFCLYIAVHQALLKSDIDVVRHELLALYGQSIHDAAGFRHLNQQVDQFYSSQLTQRLKRVVSRYGAPFRVLKSLIDDRPDAIDSLDDQAALSELYEWEISREYRRLRQRLNKGLMKSIAFIFITKVLIGLAIEVPYDLLAHGRIAWLPLGVNLLFPPLYMASLKASLRQPSKENARNLRAHIEKILFEDGERHTIVVPPQRKSPPIAKLIYGLLFLVPVAVTVFVLRKVDFNAVQMAIFFVFFSTASFLGFRLTTLVRELELTTHQSGLLASLREFFYLPFIVFGQWLSRKYSKINAVGRVLDVAIELPLKAVLRLLRQWIRFLNERHDQLY